MPSSSSNNSAFTESLSALSLLQSGLPSVTAQRVALRRAAHQVLDHPLVFEDLLALAIAGRDNALAFTAPPDSPAELEAPYIRAFMAARSRFAEDELALTVANGVAQYVILGAGLDTFAYRNGSNASGLRVFEVDHPATQIWKRERLAAEGIAIPPSLGFVPVDFERQSLRSALMESGFDYNRPAFFSWLGVIPYLTAPAFEKTAQFIASCPRGSGVAFDYAVARSALNPMERYVFDGLAHRVAEAGEPFRLFFEPGQIANDLKRQGFHDLEDLGPAEINARYFSGRADKLQIMGNFAHLVHARV